MLTLRLANRGTLRHGHDAVTRWVYLGKRIAFRSACEHSFGASNRLDVTDRFHQISRDLRQPFLDFIAEVGAHQHDRLGWFSSSFAWKDPDASDLFLLVCYLKLIESLAKGLNGGERLLVVVEDRWLYAQCRTSLSHLTTIEFGPRASLWGPKAAAAIRAVTGRAAWILSMLREYFVIARHARRYRLRQRHTCWLYSLPHPRCFVGENEWHDPFLGRLDEILTRDGQTVGRLIPNDPLGLGAKFATRAGYLYPMILELSVKRLLVSALTFWRPSRETVPQIEGLDVSLLARREWWTDFRFPLWSHHRLFYECTLEAMKNYRPAVVIFPYENQPWEKMLVSAAQSAGVGAVGYQHSTVPKFLLAYFFGGGEADSLPLPDVIITTGGQQTRLLIEGGTPPARVRLGGSLRYEHFAQKLGVRLRGKEQSTKRVLVVTAHDRYLSSALLDALEHAFPDHGEEVGVSFSFRPHPTLPLAHRSISWMTIVNGDLTPQLPTFDVVVTTGTTVGLEACFLGIPVVKFQADVLLDLDPLDALPEGAFLTASAAQLRDRIHQAAVSGCCDVLPAAVVDDIFPAVNEAVWLSAIGEIKAHPSCTSASREMVTLSRSA